MSNNRRGITAALAAALTGAAVAARKSEAQSVPAAVFPRTASETATGINPTNTAIPSHAATSEVYPARYGAVFDGVANDTVALNNALLVALHSAHQVVLPAGTALVENLIFGTNSSTGPSNHPPGMRGQGISTTLKMKAGATGTVLAARGCAGIFMRDFLVDGSGIASVCIDTSWPSTVGTTANNVYDNVWTQNFTQNGWLALNDNQTSFKNIVARGAASRGLSGIRIEGSGGAIFLDNVQASDSFLSITCQNAQIEGGFSFGVRFNESQVGVNFISFSGGTQLYANPTTSSHFEDSKGGTPISSGHYVTSIVADGLYLLSSSNPANTNTINCTCAGKFDFRGCTFLNGSSGTWNLYGPRSGGAFPPASTFVKLDGCVTSVVNFNTPPGIVTELVDVSSNLKGFEGGYSNYPVRAVYRNSDNVPDGVSANTFTSVVPAAALKEPGGYLLVVTVTDRVLGTLSATALINSVAKNGSRGASGAIPMGISANAANELTNQISVRYGRTVQINGSWFSGIDIAINSALLSGSTIDVVVVRIANPAVHY